MYSKILETLENIFSVDVLKKNFKLSDCLLFNKKAEMLHYKISQSSLKGSVRVCAINKSWINGISILAHICSDCNVTDNH